MKTKNWFQEQFSAPAQAPNLHVFLLLSMSKLAGTNQAMRMRQETPDDCVSFMEGIEQKFPENALSYTVIYTDGLYVNSDKKALDIAKTTSMQMTRHQERLRALLQAGNPRTVESVSWGQLLLADHGRWESDMEKLNTLFKKDEKFATAVRGDTLAAHKGQEPSEADIAFILTETLMFEKLRRLDIQTPGVAAAKPQATLIAYPGPAMQGDRYLIENSKRAVRGAAPNINRAQPYRCDWADVSNPADIKLYEGLSLPPDESRIKQIAPLPPGYRFRNGWMAAAATSATAAIAIAAGTLVPRHQAPSEANPPDQASIHLQRDDLGKVNAATWQRNGLTVYFSNADDLADQTPVRNGQIERIDNRDKATLAMQCEVDVENAIHGTKLGFSDYFPLVR